MKNKTVAKESSPGKQKVIAAILISALVLAGLIMLAMKATDHRAELRNVLSTRDNVRLEQLLKAHPGLIDAQLENRNPTDTWRPLHMAACYGNPEAIEILVKHKAKVNAKDANGLTPLHYTVSLSHYDCAEMLINKGADMNATGRDGRTPLDLAKTTRDKRLIDLFRIRGAKE
ncbi:MAG: ankyrin repeat domain-containing protein [Verrucomicrobiota bacterium]